MSKLSFDKESFKTRLQSDVKAFLNLTNCIDKKFYLPQTEEEKSYNSRYMFNKRKENQDPSHLKKLAKENKKAKLNPDNENDTVNAIKAHKLKEEEDEEFDSDEEEDDDDDDDDEVDNDEDDDEELENDDDDDEDSEDDEESEDDNDDDDIEADFETEDQEQNTVISPIIISDNEIAQLQPSTQLTQVDLKEKLRQKIEESRKLRGAEDPKKREKILKKREAKKQGKKNKKKAKLDANGTPNVSIAPSAEKVVVDDKTITAKKQQKTKNVESINEDADVFFGALQFEGIQKKKQTKNAHHLLKKVEAQTEKINKLTQQDPEKAKEFVEKEKLQKAVLQASGVKVRDDPKLLKKTLKRQERKKVKTAERWNDIKKKESKGIKDKIKKRESNIKARGDQKKDKKMGIKPKSKPTTTAKKPFKGNKQAKKDAKKK